MTAPLAVSPADVDDAAAAIAGQVVRTPMLPSATLSAITGASIWLKFENLQFTSSFKERGVVNRLRQLSDDERRRGVAAMSAGNHAQGLAYHATRLGIPATIVMPRFTPNLKVANTEALGATVVLHGDDLGEAADRAREIAQERHLVWVPPYDDAAIIAGQGTIALEMLDDAPGLDTLVVPVGGGGLIAGISVAAKHRRPDLRIVGVQCTAFPAMVNAVHHEHRPVGGPTIAEGIAVPRAGALTTPIIASLVDELRCVTEAAIEDAVVLLAEIEKTVAEGAGAASLAAVVADRAAFAGRTVGLVLSGGNIDARLLASAMLRGLVRSGRLSRIDVDISDVPGALAAVSTVIGSHGGNIIEVAHQRTFDVPSIKSAVLEMLIETRDRAHFDEIAAALSERYPVHTRARQ